MRSKKGRDDHEQLTVVPRLRDQPVDEEDRRVVVQVEERELPPLAAGNHEDCVCRYWGQSVASRKAICVQCWVVGRTEKVQDLWSCERTMSL